MGVGQANYPAANALNALGAGNVRIQQQQVGKQWKISQVSIKTIPAAPGCTADLVQNGQLIATSYFAGTGDVAGGDPPLYLDAGEYIEVQFTGGPANGQGIVNAIYEEIQR